MWKITCFFLLWQSGKMNFALNCFPPCNGGQQRLYLRSCRTVCISALCFPPGAVSVPSEAVLMTKLPPYSILFSPKSLTFPIILKPVLQMVCIPSVFTGQLSWRCIVLLLCISHPCTKGCIHLPCSGHLKVKSTLRQCKPNPILPDLIGRNAIYSRFTKFFQEKRRKTRGLISVIKGLQVSVEQSDWRCGCASVSSSLCFAENYFVRCDLSS